MSKDSNQTIGSLEERRIANAAADLEPIYAPQRDLWPEIENSISGSQTRTKPMPTWMPYALAASILMTVVSLGVSTNFYLNQTKSVVVASNDYIDAIEQPYMLARVSYLEEMVVQGQDLSPEIRLVLKENLEIIDKAVESIHEALATNPNDAQLIDRLIQTREQEMALFRQLTKRRVTTI